jgi:hypothetical protein
VIDRAPRERQQQRDAYQGTARDQQQIDLPRHLEPFQPGAQAHGNTADACDQSCVPQHGAKQRKACSLQSGLQQPRQHPHRQTQSRHGCPAVCDCVEMNGPDAAESEPFVPAEPIRTVQLDR